MNEKDDNFAKLSLLTIDVFFKQLLMYLFIYLFFFLTNLFIYFFLNKLLMYFSYYKCKVKNNKLRVMHENTYIITTTTGTID
jgi:hypothetical protein